jgi:hypothetical protein
MIKQIKNIEGVTSLSKKEQQNFRGGFGVDDYVCLGAGYIIVNINSPCPPSRPFMHPQGHCLCCSVEWVNPNLLEE